MITIKMMFILDDDDDDDDDDRGDSDADGAHGYNSNFFSRFLSAEFSELLRVLVIY